MNPYWAFRLPVLAGFEQTIRIVALAGGITFSFGVATGFAQTDDGGGFQDQISELRQQVNQLQSQLASSGSQDDDGDDDHSRKVGTSQLLTQLLQRVSDLEQHQREIRGQLDQLTNDVQQKTETLKKQISDMNFAAQHGGGEGASAAPASSAPAGGKLGEAPATASQTSEAAPAAVSASPLQAAQNALAKRDYASAQSYAEQALSGARSATTQAESYYILGRAHSGQKDYGQAAVSYYRAYQKSPRSSKGQHALLGVSLAMLADGKKREACQAAEKLKSEFSTTLEPNVKSSLASVKKRAGCS